VLKGLEAVRQRPAMYIGSNDEHGLNHIFYEVLDNAVDEVLAGYANTIKVILHRDDSITVEDNGRGIPVDIHPDTGKSALETVMTMLHAGGKFSSGAYKVSGGLHGVGVTCTNALSERMRSQVKRDGKLYQLDFVRGTPQGDVKVVKSGLSKDDTGTIQWFKPDPKIFSVTEYNARTIEKKIQDQAYLTSKTLFIFINEKAEIPYIRTFYFEKGIRSYVNDLAIGKHIMEVPFYMNRTLNDVVVETSLLYTDNSDEIIKTFANNILNPEGGTHLAGFKTALTTALNKYGIEQNLIDEKSKLSGEDVREGITAIVSVKLPHPQFEGQTKIKLNNPEIKGIVQKTVTDALLEFFAENPKDAKAIIQRAVLSQKARNAAKAARNAILRKGALTFTSLPGKLADCSSKDKAKSEIFIVEGDSAGGSAKQARNRATQAILPLSGKPINSEKHRLDRVLENDKLNDLVKALGCGISDQIDLSKLRYGKVIIMTDADVDGLHIVTLTLTFFYRFMRKLIEDGRVYVAQPPLFKVESGKDKYWCLNEEEKERVIAKLTQDGKKVTNVQRFKGLGEMNPEQLYNTTMDPEKRVIKKIDIKEAEEASKVFDMLMGPEVPPRRHFIMQYAKFATLDV